MNRSIRQFIRLYQWFIIWGGTIVALVLVFFFFTVPLIQKDIDMYAAWVELRQKVAKLQGKAQLLQGLNEQQLRDQFLLASSAIPIDKALPPTIVTLESLASEIGLTITDLRVANAGTLATDSATLTASGEPEDRPGKVAVNVSFSGSLEQTIQLFERLPTIRRLIGVSRFAIAIDSALQVVTTEMTVHAYYASLITDLGDVDRPIVTLNPEEEAVLSSVARLRDTTVQTTALQPQLNPERTDPFVP